jgi:hypothetical protein
MQLTTVIFFASFFLFLFGMTFLFFRYYFDPVKVHKKQLDDLSSRLDVIYAKMGFTKRV